MRLLPAILTTVLALPAFGQAPQQAEEPPTVHLSREERAKLPRLAILEFKAAPDCWSGWRQGGWGNQMATISSQLRDLFSTEIIERGATKVRLVDRERLDDLRKELEFQQSGEADTGTVQKLGKLLGVGYVMTGKITRFAYKDTWAGAQLLATGVKKASFTGRLDIRIIEVQTGEILEAFKDDETVSEASVKFLGAGTEISYDGELVNRIFEPMVQRLTSRILRAATRIDAEASGTGRP
jgi:curli biogenesis system outer membrane secretion channel CsgG